MPDRNLIQTEDDFRSLVSAHKKFYWYGVISLVSSIFLGTLSLGSVYFGYTNSSVWNWIILISLFILSFCIFALSIFICYQARSFEKDIEYFKIRKGLDLKVKSIKTFIISSYISLFGISFIIFIFHSLIVR
jgi:hypothetical protein